MKLLAKLQKLPRTYVIIASSFAVILLTSGIFVLGSYTTKSNVKGVAMAHTSKLFPTPTPTNTPTPTVINYSKDLTVSPTSTQINETTPTSQPQANGSNNSSTNINSQTAAIIHPTIFIPTAIPANPVPHSAPDCSGISSGVASIKNVYQPQIDQATQQENALLASRGLTSDSGTGQQQLSSALNPLISSENAQIASFCANYVNTGCSCP